MLKLALAMLFTPLCFAQTNESEIPGMIQATIKEVMDKGIVVFLPKMNSVTKLEKFTVRCGDYIRHDTRGFKDGKGAIFPGPSLVILMAFKTASGELIFQDFWFSSEKLVIQVEKSTKDPWMRIFSKDGETEKVLIGFSPSEYENAKLCLFN